MCAECHSTGVRKDYDAAHDRFATSFAEISVGCEACHGAGSRHIQWARNGRRGDVPDKGLPNALVSPGLKGPRPRCRNVASLRRRCARKSKLAGCVIHAANSSPKTGNRAATPPARVPPNDRENLARAVAEFVAAQNLNADRPDVRTTLGNFYARQGDAAKAEAEYRAAIRLDPSFSPAAINLSDLYRQLGRDDRGELVLRDGLSKSEKDASLHHALGLTLVRRKQTDAALEELRQAVMLEPGQSRYAYVYAIGLNSAGRRDDALAVLKANLLQHPSDRDTLSAAISLSREGGDFAAALDYAERLGRLLPDDRGISKMIEELRHKSQPPSSLPGQAQ